MRKMFFWLFCMITPLAHAQADVVWVKVESVTPRYAVTKLHVDQLCVSHRQVQYGRRFPSESAQVLGSIVGGLIGHELGHGYHRSAATFAGAGHWFAIHSGHSTDVPMPVTIQEKDELSVMTLPIVGKIDRETLFIAMRRAPKYDCIECDRAAARLCLWTKIDAFFGLWQRRQSWQNAEIVPSDLRL
jgi:hypothetical protein